jgi:hypothetical protein
MRKRAVRSLVVAASLACAADSPLERLRGELTWRGPGMMTVAECGSGRLHELGVMADVFYFEFTQRAEKTANGDPVVLVELMGRPEVPTTSAAERGVDRGFDVEQVISMQRGSCGAEGG